jgi:hypothetical protein
MRGKKKESTTLDLPDNIKIALKCMKSIENSFLSIFHALFFLLLQFLLTTSPCKVANP